MEGEQELHKLGNPIENDCMRFALIYGRRHVRKSELFVKGRTCNQGDALGARAWTTFFGPYASLSSNIIKKLLSVSFKKLWSSIFNGAVYRT